MIWNVFVHTCETLQNVQKNVSLCDVHTNINYVYPTSCTNTNILFSIDPFGGRGEKANTTTYIQDGEQVVQNVQKLVKDGATD